MWIFCSEVIQLANRYVLAMLIASVVIIAGCSSQRSAAPLNDNQGQSSAPLELCGDWPNGKTVIAYTARSYPGAGDSQAFAQFTENNMIGMPAPPGDMPSYFPLYPNGRIASVFRNADDTKIFMCTDDSVRNVTGYYAGLYGERVERCVDSLSRACYTTLSDAKAVLQSDRSTIEGPDGYVMAMFMRTWNADNEVFHIETSEAGSVRGPRNSDGRENWISVFSEPSGKTLVVIWPR